MLERWGDVWMVLMGATVNAIAIVCGTILGLILKKGIPSKVSDTAMHGLALIIFYLGITGATNGKHLIVEIISIVIGAVIGECLDLDYQMVRLGNFMEKLFRSKKGDSSISKAFFKFVFLCGSNGNCRRFAKWTCYESSNTLCKSID